MNILIFSMHFYPEIFRINDVALSIKNKGFNVDVITGKPNYPSGKIFSGYYIWSLDPETYQGINIYRMPIVLRYSASTFFLILNYLSFIFSGTIFPLFLLMRKKYDYIFCYATSPLLQAIPAIFMAKIKRVKLILNVQDLWPHSLSATGHIKNKFIIYFVQKIVDWIYANADLILVQSNGFKKYIKSEKLISKVKYWPNSVNQIISDPTQYFESPLIDEIKKKFSILFTGNLGRAQNLDVILKAADLLRPYPEIIFWLVGDGSEKNRIEREIIDRKLSNIILVGHFPLHAMPTFMNCCSALLVTLANEEIFSVTVPNKIQAYLSAGKPIIGSLNGEGAHLIKNAKCGVCVDADDEIALAKGIIDLYKMPGSQLSEMGGNAKKYFDENFNHDKLVEDLMRHFFSLKEVVK